MNCALKITCLVTSFLLFISCTATKPVPDVPDADNQSISSSENSDCLTLADFADDPEHFFFFSCKIGKQLFLPETHQPF